MKIDIQLEKQRNTCSGRYSCVYSDTDKLREKRKVKQTKRDSVCMLYVLSDKWIDENIEI